MTQTMMTRPTNKNEQIPRPALSVVGECLGMLEAMNAGNNQSFDALWRIYNTLLSAWGDDLSMRVCTHAVLTCKWRPAPAKLREIAARLESPTPNADAALTEVQTLIRRFGSNAMRHPERPSVRVMGEPDFSHPLVESAVRRIGGWARICAGEAQYQEGGFEGAFRAVYDRAETDFLEQVSVALQQGVRPAELFPRYAVFAEEKRGDYSESRLVQSKTAPPLFPSERLTPMPAKLRDMIARFGKRTEVPAFVREPRQFAEHLQVPHLSERGHLGTLADKGAAEC